MKVEIITTGNEITDGRVLNTNSTWLAQRCAELGHEVIWMTSIGDDEKTIGEAAIAAAKRAQCVIVSGGLGPTTDDITVEAVSKAFKVKLELNKKALEKIEAFFKRLEKAMPDSNKKQAKIPKGGVPLENRIGTAPGIHVLFNRSSFFFLPGVPAELYQIFDDHIASWLEKRSRGFLAKKTLRCFGISESAIAQKLKGERFEKIHVSYRVPFPEIVITLFARESNKQKAKSLVSDASKRISKILGNTIYSQKEETLPELVGKMLRRSRRKIAVAESCTGGTLSGSITDISGASEYFECGVVSYSNRSKEDLLGVNKSLIEKKGSVSPDIARSMAEGIKKSSKVDFGIGITGIAGPTGSTKDKPQGLVYIAIATPKGTEVSRFLFPVGRERFKRLVAYTAMDMLRRVLISKRGSR